MSEQKLPTTPGDSQVDQDRPGNLPDEDRRRILGKLVTGAFVAPLVLLVLDGGDSITYGY
ncbi:MAG: hypothetical protein KQH53_15120 [Desulfarculaceae bacterium]|nr:hypothetical protein [Desulfarculaceae bacterium]